MSNKEIVMTSVKVHKELYEQFKTKINKSGFFLQDLVNRSMHLYLTDESFRETIHNCKIPASPAQVTSPVTQNNDVPFSLTPVVKTTEQ